MTIKTLNVKYRAASLMPVEPEFRAQWAGTTHRIEGICRTVAAGAGGYSRVSLRGEITQAQAIRMLAPQIHKMQLNGYGYTAIVELLSENGFAVNSKGLKSYLRQAKGAFRKRRVGKEKEAQRANGGDS